MSGRPVARPPAAPWVALEPVDPPTGYLAYYYSDDLSRLPVRHVTRPGDCKSDPNFETGTFGVFSTCEPPVRSALVRRRCQYLFFVTRREGLGRVLAGMYRVGWWCGAASGPERDVRLAADLVHFVDPPLAAADLPVTVRELVTKPFRSCRPVDASATACLRDLLLARGDRTGEYLAEVDRLERFNASRTGARYPGWGQNQPFEWGLAASFLAPATAGPPPGGRFTKNQSASRLWMCPACSEVRSNTSRLRRCPACKAVVTLTPVLSDGQSQSNGA
jgi:hypothetical protein